MHEVEKLGSFERINSIRETSGNLSHAAHVNGWEPGASRTERRTAKSCPVEASLPPETAQERWLSMASMISKCT